MLRLTDQEINFLKSLILERGLKFQVVFGQDVYSSDNTNEEQILFELVSKGLFEKIDGNVDTYATLAMSLKGFEILHRNLGETLLREDQFISYIGAIYKPTILPVRGGFMIVKSSSDLSELQSARADLVQPFASRLLVHETSFVAQPSKKCKHPLKVSIVKFS